MNLFRKLLINACDLSCPFELFKGKLIFQPIPTQNPKPPKVFSISSSDHDLLLAITIQVFVPSRPVPVGKVIMKPFIAILGKPTEEKVTIPLSKASSFGMAKGESKAMREIFASLSQVAHQPTTVLLEGPTGTRKELLARAIHEKSPRAKKPFVVLDCTALPATLAERELFGHVRGAFTGANRATPGLFEQAHLGTLFIDELGET